MAKYFRRFKQGGEPYFIDESGKEVSESTARQNLVEDRKPGTRHTFVESASDTAAAKTLVGHFVQDRNQYGADGMYTVASVDGDGSATLHGPIGKGGTKTISHSDLVKNHTDLGPSDKLSQLNASESAKLEMEESFKRFAPGGRGKRRAFQSEKDTGKESKPKDARGKMDEAFERHTKRAR